MFEPNTLEPKSNHQILTPPPSRKPAENSQQRLMVGALVLLLVALGLLLYHDRDFWFPDTQEAEDQPEQSVPAIATPVQQPAAPAVAKKSHIPAKTQAKDTAPVAPSSPPVSATTQRTVLPPLEVEVVAGDRHSTVRPGTNSVRVDLQPGSPPQAVAEGSGSADTAAGVTSNAAERVQMSADAAGVVSHSVRPGYPLLARQMKVQGSVILHALISRDGAIQDLHVVSGPPILAGAAQEAVKQWRFKPHYLGTEAVETQARITVNFTISTN
ncbi:MAG: energy transducer TonB [Candidatus Sulfotelmatobacter sp.]